MATIVVFAEQTNGQARRASLECIGAARSAGGTVVAVTCGEGASGAAAAFGKAGAAEVICLAGSGPFSPDATAVDLAAVVRDSGATAFLAPATVTGKDIAPRVAAHLDVTLFSDVTGFASSGASFQVLRPWLAGKALATLSSNAPVFCATSLGRPRPQGGRELQADRGVGRRVRQRRRRGDARRRRRRLASARRAGRPDRQGRQRPRSTSPWASPARSSTSPACAPPR
jgi:electron transfer flavoprotein alpha subunit